MREKDKVNDEREREKKNEREWEVSCFLFLFDNKGHFRKIKYFISFFLIYRFSLGVGFMKIFYQFLGPAGPKTQFSPLFIYLLIYFCQSPTRWYPTYTLTQQERVGHPLRPNNFMMNLNPVDNNTMCIYIYEPVTLIYKFKFIQMSQ